MKERNLSRRLSTSVVDALKAHGHILVVKGGATALARELDDLMAPELASIEPRLKPHAPLVGEPTSTFGDEGVDQAVEDMVVKLTHALMNSDHVEDVFAEDAVIRRDIFRVVRDGLRERPDEARDGGDEGEGRTSVTVKLDALGYVAATASRRTDASTLRQALDRAASVAGARFSGFSPELREATFRLDAGGIDERLEVEEAVADELTDLVEQGIVELPTIERRIDLGRALPASEQRALRPRINAAAEATLFRSGCAATWDVADARTLRILFTPLSEQDARAVDAPTGAFAREVAALLAQSRDAREVPKRAAPPPAAKAAPPPPPVEPPAPPPPSPPPSSVPTKRKAKEKEKEAAEPVAQAGGRPRASSDQAGGRPRASSDQAGGRAKASSDDLEAGPPVKAPAKAATKATKAAATKTAATKAAPAKRTAKPASEPGAAAKPAAAKKTTKAAAPSRKGAAAGESKASAAKPARAAAATTKTTKATTKKR